MAALKGTQSSEVSKLVWIVALNVLAVFALVSVLYRARIVVSWVLVALFLALALDPLVRAMQRRGVPRGWAVISVYVAGFAFATLLVATLVPMLVEQARGFATGVPDLLERAQRSELFLRIDQRFHVLERLRQEAASHAGSFTASALTLLGGVVEVLAGALAIAVLTGFMLLFGGRLFRDLLAWIEPSRRARYERLAHEMQRAVGGYVAGTLLVASIGGTVMALTLALARVPYFLPLGLVVAALGVVPFVGNIISGTLIVLVTLLAKGLKTGLIVLAVYLVYQQIENHLLHPLVQRKTIKMNALIIALALLVGTAFAGILGALLALPAAGAIQVVLQDVLVRRRARWGESLPSEPVSEGGPLVHAPAD